MRHISILRNDLQALDSFRISDNILEEDGAVLFDPISGHMSEDGLVLGHCGAYQGSS